MSTVLRVIYEFNEIYFKISTTFCTERIKSILKIVWNGKRPKISKAIQRKKNLGGTSPFLISNYITKHDESKQFDAVIKIDT
jgi:hypothetical protein